MDRERRRRGFMWLWNGMGAHRCRRIHVLKKLCLIWQRNVL